MKNVVITIAIYSGILMTEHMFKAENIKICKEIIDMR